LSNGNRTAVVSSGWVAVRGNIGKSTGKWYFEIVCDAASASQFLVGVATGGTVLSSGSYYLGSFANSYGWGTTGSFAYNNGTGVIHGNLTGGLAATDVAGFAFDADTHRIDIYKNNTLLSTSYLDGMEASTFYPGLALYDNAQQATLNSTAAQLTYAPPTGYSAWEQSVPVQLAGQAPTLAVTTNVYLAPGVANTALTTYAPASTVTMPVYPSAGAASVTGQAPAIDISLTFAMPVASLALTPNTPTETHGTSAWPTPGTAAMQISGTPPLAVAAITTQLGAALMTGHAPTANVSYTFAMPVQAAAITGQIPVSHATENQFAYPTQGALTTSGYVVEVGGSFIFNYAWRNVTLTPAAPLLKLGLFTMPGADAVVTAAQQPMSVVDHIFKPLGSGPTLGVNAATMSLGYVDGASSGTAALAGSAPTALATDHHTIGVPASTLSVAATGASLQENVSIQPGVGVLTVTPEIPVSGTAYLVQPGAGALYVIGYPNVMPGDVVIPVGTAILQLSSGVSAIIDYIPGGTGNVWELDYD